MKRKRRRQKALEAEFLNPWILEMTPQFKVFTSWGT
jgi:hypothetical protein